ncbi:MAG TPA: hypothetical protein DCE55_10595 [Planctomycetaceae bacterium]|nr:hypothetical protein [Planctomycetaceae bacterium]
MDERTLQIRVGVVVLAAVAITGILVILFGESQSVIRAWQGDDIVVYIEFAEAPGVTRDTPVRKSGVLIGRVVDVTLNEENGTVDVELTLFSKYTIYKDEVCRIGTNSLVTGDAVLEFIKATEAELIDRGYDKNKNERIDEPEQRAAHVALVSGEHQRDGKVQADPFTSMANIADQIPQTLESIETTAADISRLAQGLTDVVAGNENRLESILTQADEALVALTRTMQRVEEIAGDPDIQANLKRTLSELPAFVDQGKQTFRDARNTLVEIEKVTKQAEENLENLKGFTDPLGARGSEMVADAAATLANIQDMTQELKMMSERVQSSRGTLGLLIKDPELYQRLNSAAANLERLTVRLGPILRDVHVLTDKMARDPGGQLLKRMLDPTPVGAGSKLPRGY